MELAHAGVGAEVRLEGFGADVVGGAEIVDEGGGGCGGGVVVDGDGAMREARASGDGGGVRMWHCDEF